MNIREAAKQLLDLDWPLGHVDVGGRVEMLDDDYNAVQAVARYAARFEDDTPVDAEWLERVGFPETKKGIFDLDNDWFSHTVADLRRKDRPVCWIGDENVSIPTRGDVRKLCDVLGIELREDG